MATIEFIDDQFDSVITRSAIVLSTDRRVQIIEYSASLYCVSVQREGNMPDTIWLSEKAFMMMALAFKKLNDLPMYKHGQSTVKEEYFDGDYAIPSDLPTCNTQTSSGE